MKSPILPSLIIFCTLLLPLHAQRGPDSASTPFLKCDPSKPSHLIRSPGSYDLVLIGDSITRRWARGGAVQKAFAPWRVLDLGHDGEHTENILFRLQNGELTGVDAKVVMIMIGTNNIGHTKDEPAWIASGVAKIIETVHAFMPKARILLVGIFPRGELAVNPKNGEPSPGRKRIAATNKLLAGLADGKTVAFIDIGDRFLDPNGNLPKSTFPDALHPTSAGYDIWYQAVRPKLDELRSQSNAAPQAAVPVSTATPQVSPAPVK